MKRRSFIRNTALGTPAVLNGIQTMGMGQFGMFNYLGESDKVLVLIQLNGGNDGLNTVIPLDQYSNLSLARPDIILDENQAIKLEDHVGLHPMLDGMGELYKEGKLGVVQAVGYPNQNRSHFRSTDIWTTASPSDELYLTGWLGRFYDGDHPDFPNGYPSTEYPDPLAVRIGTLAHKTCQGVVGNYSIPVTDPTDTSIIPNGVVNPNSNGIHGERIQYLLDTYRQTNEYGGAINDAYGKGTDHSSLYADFSSNALSRDLSIVGQLIEGGMTTKVYIVSLGGFDTHGDQAEAGDVTSGRHPILLDQVSQAIQGFQKHIEAIGKSKKVLGMTFSEFGRRIRSNASFGTDHGSAAPLFLFGECVKGGIFGDNPEIGDNVDPAEGVAMQHDFRSIYGTILKDWFEIEEDRVKSILSDEIQFLPLLELCSTTNTDDNFINDGQIRVYPSPAFDQLYIDFEGLGGEVRIELFDAFGHRVRALSPEEYPVGKYRRSMSVEGLPVGPYFVRWQSGRVAKTVRVIKG